MGHTVASILGLLGVIDAATLAVLDELPLLTNALIGGGAGANMSSMPRMLRTVAVLLLVAFAIALIGEGLDLGSPYYLVAFLVGMFLISLTDRDRFYARDLHGRR